MSEEHKITTVEKVKNPGRVAAGKRLAAISKEAKARKAEERKKAEAECTENSSLLYICNRRRTRCNRSWVRRLSFPL